MRCSMRSHSRSLHFMVRGVVYFLGDFDSSCRETSLDIFTLHTSAISDSISTEDVRSISSGGSQVHPRQV